MPRPLNTLILDVETSPIETRTWHPKAYPNYKMLRKPPILLTWAAKWRGEDRIHSSRLRPGEVIERNDSRIAESLARLVRKADVLVAHNINKFDVPKLNGRLAQWDLEPLAPVRTIDTLTIAQKKLGYPHSNLDYLLRQWGLGQKVEVHYELWERVLDGPDRTQALREMQEYCINDVLGLEKVFEKIIRYSDGVARLYEASYEGEWFCHYCGGTELEKRGTRQTQAGTFQRYRCLNPACGKYGRMRRSKGHVKSAGVPI